MIMTMSGVEEVTRGTVVIGTRQVGRGDEVLGVRTRLIHRVKGICRARMTGTEAIEGGRRGVGDMMEMKDIAKTGLHDPDDTGEGMKEKGSSTRRDAIMKIQVMWRRAAKTKGKNDWQRTMNANAIAHPDTGDTGQHHVQGIVVTEMIESVEMMSIDDIVMMRTTRL